MNTKRLASLLAFLLSVGLAMAFGQATGTDPVYVAGYTAGYPLGQQDQATGRPANPHKFSEYQAGKPSFQSGFSDGYGDGFAGRPRSVGTAPASTAAPVRTGGSELEASSSLSQAARANGYREGYNIGQSDANSNAGYNATGHNEYKAAQVGYQTSLGSITDYQQIFQDGFALGYDDGFHHRLYNSAVGARAGTAAPAATGNPVTGTANASTSSPAGGNPLPTDPERLAARPSGVYSNGLLVAQGTEIQTTLNQELDTKNSYAGQAFTLTVSVPVWVGGVAAIPAGSTIQGTVAKVERGGHFSGTAEMQLQYNTLTIPGEAPISLNVDTSGTGSSSTKVDKSEGTINGQGAHTGTNAAKGAAVGAVAGGIFGGGGGLVRGGAAGAAVGVLGGMLSHNRDITLRKGAAIRVQLQRPLELPPVVHP